MSEDSIDEAYRRLGIASNDAAQAMVGLRIELLIGEGMTLSEAWAQIFAEHARPGGDAP